MMVKMAYKQPVYHRRTREELDNKEYYGRFKFHWRQGYSNSCISSMLLSLYKQDLEDPKKYLLLKEEMLVTNLSW